MRLDYGTQLSPTPITLSISVGEFSYPVGTLKKPTLKEISEITFSKFSFYEFLLKLNPEIFYTELQKDNDGQAYWDSLTEEKRRSITLYEVIVNDQQLIDVFTEVFNFFFIEPVIYREGFFILLKNDFNENEGIDSDSIRGVISKETLPQVLDLIQQICCIRNEEESTEDIKFKNNLAKKLYDKMLKAKKAEKEKKVDLDFTLPNIISAVSNRHPTINPINVWELTIFQLLDSFNRTRSNSIFEIDSTRVSVWGDEKKTFDASLWYKNEYDKK